MGSRTLRLAAASLLTILVTSPSHAQQNLDAGKSAGQLFDGNCSACHRGAKGLLKTVTPSQLPDFLRQHYTTGPDMAQMLSGYLMSNRGAAVDRSGKRGAKPEAGANLRSDAPVGGGGSVATDNGDQGGAQRSNKRLPRGAATRPDAAEAPPSSADTPAAAGRKPRARRELAVQPAEPSLQGEAARAAERSGRQGAAKKRRKRDEPPASVAPPAAAVQPDPSLPKEPSVDSAVPVPEPVKLPPPSAADVKPAAPAEAAKPAAEPAKTADQAKPAGESSAKSAADKAAADKTTADPSKPAGEPAKPVSESDKPAAEAARPVPADGAVGAPTSR